MIARGNSGLGNKERPKESQISAKASRLKKKIFYHIYHHIYMLETLKKFCLTELVIRVSITTAKLQQFFERNARKAIRLLLVIHQLARYCQNISSLASKLIRFHKVFPRS